MKYFKHFAYSQKKISSLGIFTFSLLLFTVSCVTINQNLPDEKKEQQRILRYNISKIKEMATFYHLGIPEKERINQIDQYDKKGLQISSNTFDEEGKAERIITYTYDKEENLLSIEAKNPDSNLIFKETRTFDENNNRIELIFHNPDGTFKYKNIATYDDENRVKEMNWFWPSGPSAVYRYKYDDKKLIEKQQFDPDGSFLGTWKYQYDKKNNLIETTQFSSDSTEVYKTIYKYNADNMLVTETSYLKGNLHNKIKYEYDRKSMLLSKTHLTASEEIAVIYRYVYEYH